MKLPRRKCVYCQRAGRRGYQPVLGSTVYYECAAVMACNARREQLVQPTRRGR